MPYTIYFSVDMCVMIMSPRQTRPYHFVQRSW